MLRTYDYLLCYVSKNVSSKMVVKNKIFENRDLTRIIQLEMSLLR
jgi:hypothetical protein